MALTLFTEHDIYLFKEGSHCRLYDKLGAHTTKHEDKEGVCFAVWVPNAEHVFVIGDFNNWNTTTHPLRIRWDDSGIWERFIPGIKKGMLYKYHIQAKQDDYHVDKSDPYGFAWEISPLTSTQVWELSYVWHDAEWMRLRQKKNNLNAPISIYEVHPGSWRRVHG